MQIDNVHAMGDFALDEASKRERIHQNERMHGASPAPQQPQKAELE